MNGDQMGNLTSMRVIGLTSAMVVVVLLSFNAFAQKKADDRLRLENKSVAAEWSVAGGRLKAASFDDLINKKKLSLPADVFVLVLKDGAQIRSSEMRLDG